MLSSTKQVSDVRKCYACACVITESEPYLHRILANGRKTCGYLCEDCGARKDIITQGIIPLYNRRDIPDNGLNLIKFMVCEGLRLQREERQAIDKLASLTYGYEWQSVHDAQWRAATVKRTYWRCASAMCELWC